MNAASLLLGYREFESQERIIRTVSSSKKFDSASEDLSNASTLLIFRTSRQRTWLVATSQRLYCVLDDVRKTAPRVIGSIGKRRMINDHNLVAQISTGNRSENTGVLRVNANRGWLYSKSLFYGDDIRNRVEELIRQAMG